MILLAIREEVFHCREHLLGVLGLLFNVVFSTKNIGAVHAISISWGFRCGASMLILLY